MEISNVDIGFDMEITCICTRERTIRIQRTIEGEKVDKEERERNGRAGENMIQIGIHLVKHEMIHPHLNKRQFIRS